MKADRRVRIYDEGRADRILSQKRYSNGLPIRDGAWITQAEIVKRIEDLRDETACCSACGGPV